MERSSLDVVAALLARDADPALLSQGRNKTPTERILWLEEIQSFGGLGRG